MTIIDNKRSVTDHPVLGRGLRVLVRRDSDLRRVVRHFGAPPIWGRRGGFGTLVRIILEQQVSLASASATYGKLRMQIGQVTPRNLLSLDRRTLKRCGFSRQKTEYCRELARSVIDRKLVLGTLADGTDEAIRARLMALKGIGPWSADIYLLMVLLRPDVWPSGDLALATSAGRVKALDHRPTLDELKDIAEGWRPWRSVAARILWHDYLSRAERAKSPRAPIDRRR